MARSATGAHERGRPIRNRQPLVRSLRVALLSALAASAVGLANAADGVVSGAVADAQERPLAAVRVVLQGPRDGLERETATDERGLYRVAGLAPGRYRVSFDRAGYQWLEVRDVDLGVGAELVVSATLAETNGDEFVLRTGGPMVEAWSTGTALSRFRDALLPLPGRGRPRTALVPGGTPAVDDRWRTAGSPVLRGSSSPPRVLVDGLELVDTLGTVDPAPVDAIAGWRVEPVETALSSPARRDGAVLLALRTPGAAPSGSAELGWSDARFAAADEPTPLGRAPWIGVDATRRGSLVVGGSGLGGRLGLLGTVAAAHSDEDLRLAVESGSEGETWNRSRRRRLEQRGGSLRADWRPRPSFRLDGLLVVDRHRRDGDVADLFVVGSTEVSEPGFDEVRDDRGFAIRASGVLGGERFVSARVASSVAESELRPWSLVPSLQDQTADGRFSRGVGGGVYSGGGGFPPFTDRHELVTAGLELEGQRGGHLLGAGFEWRDERARRRIGAFDPQTACLPMATASSSGDGCDGGLMVDLAGARIRLRDDRGLVLVVDDTLSPRVVQREAALTLSDRWRPRPDLGLEVAVRTSWLELEGGAVNRVRLSEDLLERLDLAAGVAWDPGGSGHSRVFLRLARRHPLEVVDPDRGPLAPDLWRRVQLEAGSGGSSASGLPVEVVSTTDPAALGVAAGASSPVRVEGLIGAETEVLGGLAVGVIGRYEEIDDDLVRVVDPSTGRHWVVNGGDPLPFPASDGRELAVPELDRTTLSVEAWARKRLGDGWQAELSLGWGQSEGTLATARGPDLERLEGPTATEPFAVSDLGAPSGPIPGTRPWQARALGSFTFDGGTVVGASAWWASGAPLERLGASSVDLRLDQRPLGAVGAAGRAPSIWEVDLRIAHPWDLGGGELELAVELRNLFDRQATLRADPRWSLLDEDDATGLDPERQRTEEGWGRALVRQPPRRVELGVRYRW